MRKTKHIVSLITVFSFLLNSMPVYAEGEQNENSNHGTALEVNSNDSELIIIDKDILSYVKVKDKEYDGTFDAEVDCSELNEKLRQKYSKDIYFTASGKFEQADVSDKIDVDVTDFLLKGEDAGLFQFDSGASIKKQAKISKKKVFLKSEKNSCYYGQKIPDKITLISENDEDIESISEEIKITNSDKDKNSYVKAGSYKYSDFNINSVNNSNRNYSLELSQGSSFEVLKYEPECAAGVDGEQDNIFYSADDFTLVAPDGFLICRVKDDGTFYNAFSSSINIRPEETIGDSCKTIKYRLKNNKTGSEEYGAISQEKEYQYFCLYGEPKIESVSLYRKNNSGNPLNRIFHIGLISDRTIVLEAKARGSYKDGEKYPVFKLYSAKTDEIIGAVKGEPVKDSDGVFKCKYEFTLPEGESYADFEVELTVSNDAGESERVTAVYDNQLRNHLVIDSNPPELNDKDVIIRYVNDNSIMNNYGGFFIADGIVSDSETGVAKIEYKWDSYDKYIEYDLRKNNAVHNFVDDKLHLYYEGMQCKGIIESSNIARRYNFDELYYSENKEDEKTAHFRILVPYFNSYSVPNGIHTLQIRVYDYAGNFKELSGTFFGSDSGGVDNLPPTITYLNIGSGDESGKINVLPSGNYSNEMIIISFNGEDRSNSEKYTSGISKFEFRYGDKTNYDTFEVFTNENNNEKIFLSNGFVYSDSQIVAIDNGNYEYSNSISAEIQKLLKDETLSDEDKPDEYLKDMTSDTFIIEDVAPFAEYNVDEKSAVYEYADDDGKIRNDIWFNSGSKELNLDFFDETSGLNNISIIRGSESIGNYDFSKEKERKLEKTFSDNVQNLTTGVYTYSIDIYDNAGNEYKDEKFLTINVDKEKPESSISATYKDGEKENAVLKLGEENWIDSSRDFRINISGKDGYSGVNKIDVKVNGVPFKFGNDENLYSYDNREIKERTLVITKSALEAQGIKMNSDHTYNISCTAEDFAKNISGETTYTLHIDNSDPKIDSVEVKSVNTPKGDLSPDRTNMFQLLQFGVFSKSSLTFKVKASDEEFDSGINRLEVGYIDADNNLSMVTADSVRYNKEEDCFEFDVELQSGITFDKCMMLRVVDNYGKVCTRFEKVSSDFSTINEQTPAQHDENWNYINVVIEDIAPQMDITLPEPDYIDMSDGEKNWFSAKRRSVAIDAQDDQSGLSSVSVIFNGKKLDRDCENRKLISPDDVNSILREKYSYTFYTDAPDAENTDIPDNGEYVLEFNSIDNSGNISDKVKISGTETEIDKYIYYIDDTAPEVVSVSFEPTDVNGIDKTEDMYSEPEVFMLDDLHYGLFFKTDYDLKVSCFDSAPTSGLKKVNYRLISYADISQPQIVSEDSAEINAEGYAVIHVDKGFKGRIVLSAEDNVGNISEEKSLDGFISEDTAPELTMTFSNSSDLRDADGNELYTDDISVTVTITDTQSGIKNCRVNLFSEKTGESGNSEEINVSDIDNPDSSFNGWTIEQREANLITKISKTYTFSQDDNNIQIRAIAKDNCENETVEPVESKKFTVDKTNPVIDVSCTEGYNGSLYYNKDQRAVITLDITERNFDESLIKAEIENTFNGNKPEIVFSSSSADKHKAVLTFSEGDYVFSVSGTDRAGHKATVNTPYDGIRRFSVDETLPVVETNFESYNSESAENIYFSSSRKAKITIREHNFDQNLVNLAVMSKQPGASHDEYDMSNTTGSFVKYSDWKTSESDPDIHTIEFDIDRDSVYQLVISPEDKAGNHAGSGKTRVFEIDTQKPVVVKKNGQSVTGKENEIEFIDIYTDERKDEPSPSIEFDDINFDHLEYSIVKFVPATGPNRELAKISAEASSGQITEKEFILDEFKKDGTYALEIRAVDKAGNVSVLNKNTYVKMSDKEVLAYIPDSNIENGTGLFSLEYENGEAISKRPENISDMDIVVMAKDKSDVKILLRDMNGDEKDTMLSPESEDKTMYGVGVYTYKLSHEFFIENYQSDTDTELHLTVMNGEKRIDLAKIHIDNIAPSAETDKKFKSWHWYPGNDPKTIVISDISELLNVSVCKVYDKGKEIPFDYSEDSKTISFVLDKGWHDIGVHLEDYAGNKYDIQQVDNINVGYFWLWIILGGTLAVGGTAAFILLKKRIKK